MFAIEFSALEYTSWDALATSPHCFFTVYCSRKRESHESCNVHGIYKPGANDCVGDKRHDAFKLTVHTGSNSECFSKLNQSKQLEVLDK